MPVAMRSARRRRDVPTGSGIKIALATRGMGAGVDEETFANSAASAKAGCPVSRALAGLPEITLVAELAGA